MNQQTTDVLSTLHEECYFQKRPQPLIELLYDLGVFGRVAEVFWTYHQFGVQSGKWVCQISSSYLAEKLRTDVRTIQRANDKLACLGLIKRTRVKRRFSSSEGEAPAITEITIPDGLVETLLSDSPRRSRPTPSNPNQEPVQPHETTSDPVNSAPCPTSDEIQSPAQPASFTTVNKHSRLGDANTPVQSAAKASARDVHEAKRRLPEILRRAYEMSIMRGDSNV